MAARKSDLPEDVVSDGEVCVEPARGFRGVVDFSSPTKFGSKSSDGLLARGAQPGNNKLDHFEPRHESGYGSLLSQSSSLSSPASSLGSSKFESVSEDQENLRKTSDDFDQLENVTDKMDKLDLVSKQEDEGIECSLPPSAEKDSDSESEENFDLEGVFSEEDGDGDTILHNTILNNMISVVFCLIKLCPDVDILNKQNKLFQTPLHLATLTNLSKVVEKLVDRGVDVLMRDQQGNTALHIACRSGNKEIIETIVESVKGDSKRLHKLFTLRNSEGLTCLHIAADCKYYKIMGYLFNKGADVNIGDAKSGRTVLHYAVEKRDMETVKWLLTHKNIDIDCVTYKGESPLVIAYWRNYQEIVKKLRSKGAYFSFDLVNDWEDEETLS